jgi:trk system potassium uptake protein TrkA
LGRCTTIGSIIRDEEALIAHDDTTIQTGDHVILFLVDKKHIRYVEKLFHVGLSAFWPGATLW